MLTNFIYNIKTWSNCP